MSERISAAPAGVFQGVPRGRRPRLRPGVVAAVFVGGCVGGLGRYEVVRAWPTAGHGFPWSTLVVNASGAFVLALLLVLTLEVLAPTTYLRPLLGTGFCGAWTTFSSVVVSTDQLVAHGHPATGLGYLLASIAAGLASAAAGLFLGRAFAAGRRRLGPTGSA